MMKKSFNIQLVKFIDFFFGSESIGIISASLLTGAIAECTGEVSWEENVSSNREHSPSMSSFGKIVSIMMRLKNLTIYNVFHPNF